MYSKSRQRKTINLPGAHRWIARIFPSGHFSCGKIPQLKEVELPPHLQEWELDTTTTVCYEGGRRTERVNRFLRHKETGAISDLSSPDLATLVQDLRYLSSEATPKGLTDIASHATGEDLLGGGEGNEATTPLGLSTVPNSRNEKTSYGLNGISQNGRANIREGSYILEHHYKNSGLMFATLTLPHRGDELVDICFHWSKIVHRYFEEMQRIYERRGCIFEYVCVVEIQEKRWRKHGEVAPHLHYVANCRHKNGSYIVSPLEVRECFQRVCARFVESDADFSACENIQKVRKSAGRYLSKYFSKGGKILADINRTLPGILPKHWWKISPSVRKSVQKNTCTLYDDNCWDFINNCYERVTEGDSAVSINPVYVAVSEDTEALFGYWGQVSPKWE